MDNVSATERSRQMSRIRSKDTGPERLVRSLLHRAGFRYRLHRRDLPGTPDLVFPSRHKIVLVNGCFWHQHSGCVDGRVPKTRVGYWAPKLKKNRLRDRRNIRALRRLGWQVEVVWECEVEDLGRLKRRLKAFLNRR